jgi:hypothetical protein
VEWLRDGEPIGGATAQSYVLTTDDLGHRVRARVQWVMEGYEPLSLLSPFPKKVRTTPTISATLERVGQRVLVHVTVLADGVDRVGSMIAVRNEEAHVIARKPLRADGTATLRLTDQAPGRHTYTVVSRITQLTRWASVDRSINLR